MADSLNSGNILTTQIGGNVVSIDPNKIVGSDGVVKDRLVNQEDFVMYANLTAKIFPRSKLLVGAAAGDEISVEIADGELNFLKPKNKNKNKRRCNNITKYKKPNRFSRIWYNFYKY